jgi:uncharacterized protein YbaP (TraB family)
MLFQVTKAEGDQPTYIFGALHIAPEGKVENLIERAKNYLLACEIFYSEVDLDRQREVFAKATLNSLKWDSLPKETRHELDTLRKVLLLPRGIFLGEYLSTEVCESLVEFCEKVGIKREQIEDGTYQPWHLASQIVSAKISQTVPNIMIDRVLFDIAKNNGKEMRALETPEAIYPQIYGHLTKENQLALLKDALEEEPMRVFSDISNAYMAEDYQRFYEIDSSLHLPQGSDSPTWRQKIKQATFEDRNLAWVDLLLAEIGVNKQFVTFGASHLGGEEGIIELLTQRGCQVNQIPLQN